MTIDWTAFAPWPALIGGAIIGAAASLLILANGRIAGISGIIGGLLRPMPGEMAWRMAFIAGLIVAPVIYMLVHPLPSISIDGSYPVLIVGGLLVGIGTRYASGCTSGHGVCGVSRLSVRSLVATLAFMCAGFVTVWFVRHLVP